MHSSQFALGQKDCSCRFGINSNVYTNRIGPSLNNSPAGTTSIVTPITPKVPASAGVANPLSKKPIGEGEDDEDEDDNEGEGD